MFAGPRDLEAVSLDEAQERWHNELEFRGLGGAGPVEEIDVTRALGRVSAQSVMARRPSPHYYAAAVDGLAVKSTRTFGATPGKPVRVHLAPDATFVDTGSALPEGTDAVVPISELQFVNAEEVDVLEPSVPWRFVSPMGEDMEAAEVIVPNHRRIRPSDMGAMLRGGVARLRVGIRPRVAFLPVGGYLVPPGTEPAKGQRVESITTILGALTEQIGADPVRMDIVAERTEALDEVLTLERRKQFDLLVIISGKSHGSALPAAWVAHHGSLVVYGANIKPGHSVALGMVDQLPVIVLPGNAVSSYIAFDLFARPLIARRLGLHDLGHVMLSAVLGQGIVSPHGIDEFLRINLTRVDGKRIAFPISRGADIVTSLVRASGILHVPADAESIPDGTPVEVQLLDPQASLEGNILLVGTYDPAFDLLRNAIARRNSDVHLQSANVGSRAGLRALRKGYAHAAGLHLFDDETGTYNIHHLQENMPDT
ncbi:MAG: molybdopterin biosynthesis protein, partial [Armatimonadetes bacterium]|nr:molybdopterin biosynthesis protein [Armatimonadota bacterium]